MWSEYWYIAVSSTSCVNPFGQIFVPSTSWACASPHRTTPACVLVDVMFQATPHAAPRHVSGHPSRIATSTCRTHCSSRHQLSSVRLSPHSYQHLSTADTCVRLSLSLFSLRCHAGWLFANTTSVAHTDTHFLQPLTRFSRCWPRRMRLWSVICTQREICTKRDSISYSIFVFKLAIIHPHQTLHQNIILHHLYTEVCTIIREVLLKYY